MPDQYFVNQLNQWKETRKNVNEKYKKEIREEEENTKTLRIEMRRFVQNDLKEFIKFLIGSSIKDRLSLYEHYENKQNLKCNLATINSPIKVEYIYHSKNVLTDYINQKTDYKYSAILKQINKDHLIISKIILLDPAHSNQVFISAKKELEEHGLKVQINKPERLKYIDQVRFDIQLPQK